MSKPTFTITGEAIARDRIEQLLAEHALLAFEACDFQQADMSRLNLQDCSFSNCAVLEASFYAANLARTRWQRCRGGHADFESADLVDAHFTACDLNNASWRRAKLASASYRGCKLTGANFEEVSQLGLSFEDCLLIGADLRRMSFRKATADRPGFLGCGPVGLRLPRRRVRRRQPARRAHPGHALRAGRFARGRCRRTQIVERQAVRRRDHFAASGGGAGTRRWA